MNNQTANQFANLSAQHQQTGGMVGMQNIAPPSNEPTVLATANELLNHVATLEAHMFLLRGALFGEGESPTQSVEPTCFKGMLASACARVASLCGDLATVKSRLGV